jgi:rSAM/selenodomain-associated transferase 1
MATLISDPASATGRVLGVFAKHPQPGQVKTRLAVELSSESAARIAEAFLLDAIERLTAIQARRVLAYAPLQARPYFEAVAGKAFSLAPQADGDLGRRMADFFRGRFGEEAQSVVLVGTDSPTLPLSHIEQAFQELERADVVLGPATDGGYYLVGCACRLPPIFDGIAWGGSRVFFESVQRLQDPAWRVAVLPPWYDVDTLDDWRMLQGHVAALRLAGVDPGVPHTERLLKSIL